MAPLHTTMAGKHNIKRTNLPQRLAFGKQHAPASPERFFYLPHSTLDLVNSQLGER